MSLSVGLRDAVVVCEMNDVKHRLTKEPEQITALDEKERTVLHWAAQGGDDHLVSYLISEGANVSARSKSGLLPLHTAVKGGHTKVVELFIPSIEVLQPDEILFDRMLIHWAAENGDKDTVQLLFDNGVKGHYQDLRGRTAAEAAEQKGHKHLSKLLRKHEKKDENDKDEDNNDSPNQNEDEK